MICKKCGHDAEPISAITNVPGCSITPDIEDKDYKDHSFGLDVSNDMYIGLLVCRNCHGIQGYWIEDDCGADFHADWGKPATQPQCAGVNHG